MEIILLLIALAILQVIAFLIYMAFKQIGFLPSLAIFITVLIAWICSDIFQIRRLHVVLIIVIVAIIALAGVIYERSRLIPCGLYANCTELKRVYPRGVDSARFECAEDRRRLDRDGDGWACEPFYRWD